MLFAFPMLQHQRFSGLLYITTVTGHGAPSKIMINSVSMRQAMYALPRDQAASATAQ
jgi:hypothetical protein